MIPDFVRYSIVHGRHTIDSQEGRSTLLPPHLDLKVPLIPPISLISDLPNYDGVPLLAGRSTCQRASSANVTSLHDERHCCHSACLDREPIASFPSMKLPTHYLIQVVQSTLASVRCFLSHRIFMKCERQEGWTMRIDFCQDYHLRMISTRICVQVLKADIGIMFRHLSGHSADLI